MRKSDWMEKAGLRGKKMNIKGREREKKKKIGNIRTDQIGTINRYREYRDGFLLLLPNSRAIMSIVCRSLGIRLFQRKSDSTHSFLLFVAKNYDKQEQNRNIAPVVVVLTCGSTFWRFSTPRPWIDTRWYGFTKVYQQSRPWLLLLPLGTPGE